MRIRADKTKSGDWVQDPVTGTIEIVEVITRGGPLRVTLGFASGAETTFPTDHELEVRR